MIEIVNISKKEIVISEDGKFLVKVKRVKSVPSCAILTDTDYVSYNVVEDKLEICDVDTDNCYIVPFAIFDKGEHWYTAIGKTVWRWHKMQTHIGYNVLAAYLNHFVGIYKR